MDDPHAGDTEPLMFPEVDWDELVTLGPFYLAPEHEIDPSSVTYSHVQEVRSYCPRNGAAASTGSCDPEPHQDPLSHSQCTRKAINLHAHRQIRGWLDDHGSDPMTPMTRYLSSSPEEDPQPLELVLRAASSFDGNIGGG